MQFETRLTPQHLGALGRFRCLLLLLWVNIVCAGMFVLFSVVGDWGRDWDRQRMLTFAGCLWAFLVIYVALLLRRRNRAAYEELAKLGEPPVTNFRLTEEHLEINSRVGATQLRWAAVRRLRLGRGKLIWRLFLDSRTFIVLPADQLTEQAKEFLVTQVLVHGGKVR